MEILLSPAVLFFALGLAAAYIRSNLEIPEVISKAMAIYLMAAIGLKGGVQVSQTGFTLELAIAGLAGLLLSLLLPLPAYWTLRRVAGLDRINAGAVAAHYGSVSVVTFVTGVALFEASGMPVAGYMVAVLALMEAPAIIVGLWLAQRSAKSPGGRHGAQLSHTLRDGSLLLLIGGFGVGLLSGPEGFAPVKAVFEDAFRGILCLFLLDLGLTAARHLMRTRSLTPLLGSLAVGLALFNGTIGVLVGAAIGLEAGSASAMGILAGSASYIAAPAAIKVALPEADLGLPIAMSVAITFPFNILIGIPLLSSLASYLT